MNARRRQRGMSLLEGLIAGVVLAFGLLGALQGFIFASQQNSSAAKMTRATAVAAQVRIGLQTRTRQALLATFLSATNCKTSGYPAALTEKPATAPTGFTACVVDLDATDANAGPAAAKLVPGLVPDDEAGFDRAIIYVRSAASPEFDQLVVVVSWHELGARRYLRQVVGLYDPAVNGVGVEL